MTRRGKGGGAGKPAPRAEKARLAVLVDGVALPDDEARATWERFSAHMDAHQGDTAGFASQNGYATATPEYRRGQAVLLLTRRQA